MCGKRGKRPCPATGGLICPACCGSNRGSKLSCPPECTFFPFGHAGYDLWQAVNQSWAAKTMEYLQANLSPAALADIVKRFVPRGGLQRDQDALAIYFPSIYHGLLVHRDADGKTIADRWEAQNWPGLNNDERLMMIHRRHSLPTVIESQRQVNAQSLECLDLLEPDSKPFIILDRTTALEMPRFTKLLVWLTHYPHFRRIGAVGLEIPDTLWPAWQERFQQQLADAQKLRPGLSAKQLLAEHLPEASTDLTRLAEEARQRIFQSIDMHHCVAEFRVTGSRAELVTLLESKPDFQAEASQPAAGPKGGDTTYAWLRRGESQELENEQPNRPRTEPGEGQAGVIGKIHLRESQLVVETFSKQTYQFARKMVERYFGREVQFERESIVDLAKQVLDRRRLWPDQAKEPANPAAAAPEQEGMTPEVKRRLVWDAHTEYFGKLLDDSVPRLGNRTPRAAAHDPATRPQLVQWLKDHLHHLDIINRRDGLDLNLDWVLDELGVPELK